VFVIIAAPLAIVSPISRSLDVRVVDFAEVVPHARIRGHDVRLIAAVGDHVVRSLLKPQMLAAEVPPDVHQLHGVERRPAAPRVGGGMRALTLERVLDRDDARPGAVSPRHVEVVADVREEADIDVLEDTGAHEIRFAAAELLRHSRPELQRSRQMLPLHDLLHRQRGGHLKGHA
jgi:hypothetical protein